MKTRELPQTHVAVINELKKAHLTSFEILKRLQNISLILVVYNILDELKRMGILKSYTKQNMKYHYIVSE
jgi:predicted transcriptional regulator